MKYDIVGDNIKIWNNIIYSIDKDILDIIHSLEKENQELKADYGTKAQVKIDLLKEENEKLKAELQLYQGALKREHEAIHRVNDLEKVIKKAIEYIESKNNGHYCIINGEEKGAFTFALDFDEAREFIWELLDILKEVE